MVSQGSTKDHQGIEIEKFITLSSWRKGHEGRSGQDARREQGRTWALAYIRVPSLRPDWSIQTKKSRVL